MKMKTLRFLVFAALALGMAAACSEEHENTASIHGKWKIIEEENPWDTSIIQPVDYYTVWEFFPNGMVKHYYNSANIDVYLKTYELKSDLLYIYYENKKDELHAHTYRCRFIDAEKNKIEIKYLQGLKTDRMQPLLWIYERVNEQ
jgi:hypothetical protein